MPQRASASSVPDAPPEGAAPSPSPQPERRGPPVPPPPGPAVPAPPVIGESMQEPVISHDPIHAPLDTSEIALPSESEWEIREPGSDAPVALGENSWSGVRIYDSQPPPTFEADVAPVDADTWGDDETQSVDVSPERKAEQLIANGELGEALRIYQELAVERPDEPHLWDRVAEIARMLQQRSS